MCRSIVVGRSCEHANEAHATTQFFSLSLRVSFYEQMTKLVALRREELDRVELEHRGGEDGEILHESLTVRNKGGGQDGDRSM